MQPPIEGIEGGPPVRVGVIGAGHRGRDVYAGYCLAHPDEANVEAVADPDPTRRHRLADRHGLPPHARFEHWRDLLAHADRLDGVVIATPDAAHVDPAIEALQGELDVLIEKPIHPTREGVRRLRDAAREATATVTVAHVLRYTPFFQTIRRLLDEGRIGELVTIEHTENIGYWHFAHSYVRGNWRRTVETSPMILAKACHDLDLLRWFAGRPCSISPEKEAAPRVGQPRFKFQCRSD